MAITTGVGLALGAGASLLSGIMAGDAASKEMARARAAAGDKQAQAMLSMAEAVEELEKVGIPSIEAQKIVMEQPELVGLQEVHQIATSKMEDIESDPRLRQAQMEALEDIQGVARTGRTEGEQAQGELDRLAVAGEESARRKAILQSMAERGIEGSGAELIAQLSGSQSASQRRMMEQLQRSSDREGRKMAAIQNAAAMGGNIRGQDFEEQARVASAADQIARFNMANRIDIEGRNLQNRQNIANQQAALANQQEMYNKGLIGTDYDRRMGRATSIANVKTNQAAQHNAAGESALAAGQAAAEGILKQGQGAGDIIMGGTEAYLKYGGGGGKSAPSVSGGSGGTYCTMPSMPLEDGGIVPMTLQPKQVNPMSPPIQSPSATGYAGGGVAIISAEEDDRIIPGGDFSGDKLDAKINSGEMVLNVEQQQRLMDLLKGYRSLSGLGDENIVEEPPVDNPEVELPQDLPSMPPPSVSKMANGGVAGGDSFISKLAAAHGKMISSEDDLKRAQKETRAKIKALETLMK